MPALHIHRDHDLGLERAREVAWRWAEDAEKKFDMECTVLEGDNSDTVEFTRSGISGTLEVAADHFTLDAQLGFLLGAFAKKIESEIEGNLDALLAKEAKRGSAAAKKAAPKKAAAKKR